MKNLGSKWARTIKNPKKGLLKNALFSASSNKFPEDGINIKGVLFGCDFSSFPLGILDITIIKPVKTIDQLNNDNGWIKKGCFRRGLNPLKIFTYTLDEIEKLYNKFSKKKYIDDYNSKDLEFLIKNFVKRHICILLQKESPFKIFHNESYQTKEYFERKKRDLMRKNNPLPLPEKIKLKQFEEIPSEEEEEGEDEDLISPVQEQEIKKNVMGLGDKIVEVINIEDDQQEDEQREDSQDEMVDEDEVYGEYNEDEQMEEDDSDYED